MKYLVKYRKPQKDPWNTGEIWWGNLMGNCPGYSFREKNLAGYCTWKNFMAAKALRGLYKGNCLRAKLRKVIVLEGVSIVSEEISGKR